MRLVYLAHPADAVEAGQRDLVAELVAEAKERLIEEGLVVFDPVGHCSGPMADPRAVWEINESVLARADGVLALLPHGVPTTGTPMEILVAWQLKKPLAVIGEAGLQLHAMGVEAFDEDDVQGAVDQLRAALVGTPGASARKPVIGLVEYTLTTGSDPLQSPRVLKWTGDKECEPKKHYEGDAGYDLVVATDYVIRPGQTVDVDCGVYIELPYGLFGRITGRSSTLRKKALLVNEGIIDQGYRGRLWAATHNLGETAVKIKRGDRIAQLIIHELAINGTPLQYVDELSESDRSVQGFGSTG